jgi:outer membrane receptor protein involved in Fe transport
MYKSSRAFLARLSVSVAILSSSATYAQQAADATPAADSGGLQEVVVSARRKEESLIKVPVSVSVIDATQIHNSGAVDLSQIAQLAPQIMLSPANTGAMATFSIRGLGSSTQDAGLEQTVSINIDGTQIGHGTIANVAMFDLKQVEVLKGPQALFFGKNSPAGVVSIVSNGPEDHENYVHASYEVEAFQRVIEAAGSLPLTDTLGIRLAVRGSEQLGWLENHAQPQPYLWDPTLYTQGAPHSRQPQGGDAEARLTVGWVPNDAFNATLKATINTSHYDGYDSTEKITCLAPSTLPTDNGIPDLTGNCGVNGIKSSGSMPQQLAKAWPLSNNGVPYNMSNNTLATLSMNYTLKPVTISSQTGYYKAMTKGFDVNNFSSSGLYPGVLYEADTTFSQEFRAVTNLEFPVNFTVGAYYEWQDRQPDFGGFIFISGTDPNTGAYYNSWKQSIDKGQTYSGFAQARWAIVDNVELAGGARYTRELKTTTNENTYVNPTVFPGVYTPEGQVVGGTLDASNVSPEATLTWHPERNSTIYAAYKTGYKSGGFANPTLLTAGFNNDNIGFGSEKAKGGEIGAKAELFDRRLRLESTVYLYDYTNLQVSEFDAATISFIVKNAASARIKGVELSADWLPINRLVLNFAGGFNQALFRSYPGAPCYQLQMTGCVDGAQDLAGQHLARAPQLSLLAGGRYDFASIASTRLEVHADLRYSSNYLTNDNGDPKARQPAYTIFNTGLRWYADDSPWELDLIGRNLANKWTVAWSGDKVVGGPNQYFSALNRAREIILQAAYKF